MVDHRLPSSSSLVLDVAIALAALGTVYLVARALAAPDHAAAATTLAELVAAKGPDPHAETFADATEDDPGASGSGGGGGGGAELENDGADAYDPRFADYMLMEPTLDDERANALFG